MKTLRLLRLFQPSGGRPAGLSLAAHARWLMVRMLARMGWPGAVGLGLAVFCAVFYWSWLLPMQAKLDAVRQSAAQAGDEASLLAGKPRPLSAEEKLASFYQFFPRTSGVPDQLEKVYAAAERQALRLDQGDYRAVREGVGKLVRYQITLPVKGTYPQIRQFVTGVLTDVPSIALENIQFERQKVGETNIEAKIRLVMYLERAS